MKKRDLGTVFMAIGGFIMLLEIFGMLTGTLGGPKLLYFVGGLLDGLGMVFVLSGFAVRAEYRQKQEMM